MDLRNRMVKEHRIEVGDYEIIYDADKCLGYRVYEGRIETQSSIGPRIPQNNLAVKLRTIDKTLSEGEIENKYWNEIKNAINLPAHNNVAGYKRHHACNLPNEPTVIIVTDLCNHEKLETHLGGFSVEKKKDLLVQLGEGLKHIHMNQIAHRDLKPSNVLLSLDRKNIKIIDFGISKEFAFDKNTIIKSTGFSGSLGWVASEMCSDDRSKEFKAWVKADIYSLGLLIYYIFTNGEHPFKGNDYIKQKSIDDNNQPDFSVIESDKKFHDRYLLIDLLKAMLSHEPDARPGITKILQHCFTWDAVKKMSYIKNCHRYFEQPCDEDREKSKRRAKRQLKHNGTVEQRMAYIGKESIDNYSSDDIQDAVQFDRSGGASKDNDEPVRTREEQKALERTYEIIGEDWVKLIKDKLEDPNSGNNQRPYENSLTDLVRYIRNTHEYYYKKPEEVKSKLGSRNEGMWNFIASNFPKFFIYLFNLMKERLEENDEKKDLQEEAKNCELPYE